MSPKMVKFCKIASAGKLWHLYNGIVRWFKHKLLGIVKDWQVSIILS